MGRENKVFGRVSRGFYKSFPVYHHFWGQGAQNMVPTTWVPHCTNKNTFLVHKVSLWVPCFVTMYSMHHNVSYGRCIIMFRTVSIILLLFLMALYLQIGGELGHNAYIHGYPTYSPSKSVPRTFHSKLPPPRDIGLPSWPTD